MFVLLTSAGRDSNPRCSGFAVLCICPLCHRRMMLLQVRLCVAQLREQGSNLQPSDSESDVLPVELSRKELYGPAAGFTMVAAVRDRDLAGDARSLSEYANRVPYQLARHPVRRSMRAVRRIVFLQQRVKTLTNVKILCSRM